MKIEAPGSHCPQAGDPRKAGGVFRSLRAKCSVRLKDSKWEHGGGGGRISCHVQEARCREANVTSRFLPL